MKKLILILSTPLLIQNSFAQSDYQIPKLESIEVVLNGLSPRTLSGGGSIGGFGGGDTEDIRKIAAWFYGNAPIRTCYNISKSFGISEKTAEESISKAFQIWSDYFKQKKINQSHKTPINFKFKFVGKCRGEEDLVLYLGTGPIFQNLQDLKAFQTLVKPVAYANKTHLAPDFKWSKGYIRFVENFNYSIDEEFYPDWRVKNRFLIMLVHELGHVLGFKHTPNTLISNQIVNDLFIQDKKVSLSIDGSDELIYCQPCDYIFKVINSESTHPIFKDASFYLKGNALEFSNSATLEKLSILHTEKRRSTQTLISVFQEEDSKTDMDAVYFLKSKNEIFVLILEGQSGKIFKDGSVVAEVKRSLP